MQDVRTADGYAYMAKLYLIDSDFEHTRQSGVKYELRIRFTLER